MVEITPELAELCGIIAGDGHLSRYISKRRTDYRIEIAGDNEEEKAYFEHVSSLFFRVFGKKLTLKHEQDYARLYTHSKEILLTLESLGIPVGKKSDIIAIPPIFLNNKHLTCHFIRGLADTDFSIGFKKGGRKNNSYPQIIAEFASSRLNEDILKIFKQFGFTYYYYTKHANTNFGKFIHYRIEINGRENLKKWIALIGFSNPKHLTKIQLWEIQGFCQPRTTIRERLKIMEEVGKVVPTSP